MHEIVNEILTPSEKIQTFKKGLISALKCINIKHRYKQFSNTIYGDWHHQDKQIKMIRKNSQIKLKNEQKNQVSHKNIKIVRQRNSFPRPHNNAGKKYKNIYQKVEKVQIQSNIKEGKENRQHQNHKKIILNIRRIKSNNKLPRLSNQKNISSQILNQASINGICQGNFQTKNQHSKQANLIIVNRLKNSLRLNKKIFNQKPQKPERSTISFKGKSLQVAHMISNDNKAIDHQYGYSIPKQNMDICSWWEQEQYKQSNMQTPTFGIL